MKRLLALLLIVCPAVFAQSTTVSGTVTDLGAQTWNNGTFNFQFVPGQNNQGQYTWTGGTLPKNIAGVMNGSGAYSVSIPSNTAITPGGTRWQGTFCPQATSPCFTASAIIITGATFTFNVTPPAISISLISPPPGPMLAYADAEISSANIGSFYYNLSSQGYRVCQAINALQFCTTWAPIASGGPGASFSAITSGTNTIANMLCGTGCSIGTTGSGTIAATTATTATNVPFGGVTAGTNTNPLLIGTGGSLTPTGSGTITATGVPFSGVSAGTNTAPGLFVGSGGSLTFTGTGTINASAINGVRVIGTPTAGQSPIATGPTQASWGNIVGFNQTIQNNTVALPQRPAINFVPPLLAADNNANNRTDINCPVAVGVGPTHSSGCVPDPTASGLPTDYLARDMSYKPNVAGGTILPDLSTAIQYVSGTCNGGIPCSDSNNGLSWGFAKLTISGAACNLPLGNCGSQIAGNGTIFVGPGYVSNAAGSTFGIWMLGLGDPNFASPPVGWLKACSHGQTGCGASQDTGALTIIGISNVTASPNGHKPRVLASSGFDGNDRNKPAIWLSSVNQTLWFSNLAFQYPARAFVLGECSDHTRTGTCPVVGVTFDNMGALLNQTAANGPCTDITGQSFWLWFQDGFGCGGNAYQATGGYTSNNAAAFLVDGSTNQGNGLIHIHDSNFAGGGVKFINGANGGSIYIDNITEEGDFVDQIPPAVWFTNYGAATDAILSNIQIADAGAAGAPVVQNDGTQNGIGPTVFNTSGSSGIAIIGPAHVLNQPQFSLVNQNSSVLSQYQTGFFSSYVVGETDVARRIGGLSPTRFASTGIFTSPLGSPAPWAITSFAGVSTLTLNVADPFGGTGAATASSTNAADEQVTFNSGNRPGGCTAYTPNAGDWIVVNTYIKNNTTPPAGPTIQLSTCGGAPPSFSATHFVGPMIKGDGQWSFVWTAYKISGGALIGLNANVHFNSANPVTVYAPTLNIIPAGALSDNEVLEYASSMNSVDNACTVGTICNVSGHPLSVDSFVLRSSGFTSTLTGGTLTGNRTVTPADASGTNVVLLGPITGGKCTHTVGTTGAIQETPNDCGNGGGGSGTVNNASQWSIGTYVNSGVTNFIGGIPAPTGPNNVVQVLTSTPIANNASQGAFSLLGVPVRTNATNSDTVTAVDRNSSIIETFNGASAVSISSTLFTNGFAFKIGARSLASSVVVTPTTGTCNGGASCTVTQGENATFTLDNTGNNLFADIHPPHLIAGAGILFTPSDYSLTISAPGAVGTTGSPVNGNLTKFSGAATITNGDLSGDVTTAGTLVATVPRVNGITYPAGPSTIGFVPVLTGVSAITYELLPVASLVSATTTANGQACTLAATCNVNVGAGAHSISLNQGNGNPITGLALTTNQIPVGVTSADPAPGNLSELSFTLYGADTGTQNILAACSTPTALALHVGQIIEVLPKFPNNNGAPTLNWCTIGAKVITAFGTTLNNNDLVTTQNALFLYDGANMELLNPQTNRAGSPPSWDNINNAANNKTFSNAGFSTTFNQTSNVPWIFANITPAASAAPQNSPTISLNSQYGSSNLTDSITLASIVGTETGVNPHVNLTLSHTGTSGTVGFDISAFKLVNTAIGNIPLTVNAITGTTADLLDLDVAGTKEFYVINNGGFVATGNAVISGTINTGTNGGTGGAVTLNGATSGACTISVSATGGAALGLCGTSITPANLIVAPASPVQGVGHFAGSTQTITSSPVVSGDLASSLSLTTPNIGAATGTSLYATGIIDGKATMNVSTTTPCTLGTASANCSAVSSLTGYTVNEHATAATSITYNLPTAAAGLQYCVANGYNGTAANTGILTIATSASGQFIIFTDGTLTATGGNITSSGSAGDAACVIGVDTTHWILYVNRGTWTKH